MWKFYQCFLCKAWLLVMEFLSLMKINENLSQKGQQQKRHWCFIEQSGVGYHQDGGENRIQVQFWKPGWHWKAKCPQLYQPARLSSFHTNDFARSTVFTSTPWRTCKQWPLVIFRVCFSHPLHQSWRSSGWHSVCLAWLWVHSLWEWGVAR